LEPRGYVTPSFGTQLSVLFGRFREVTYVEEEEVTWPEEVPCAEPPYGPDCPQNRYDDDRPLALPAGEPPPPMPATWPSDEVPPPTEDQASPAEPSAEEPVEPSQEAEPPDASSEGPLAVPVED